MTEFFEAFAPGTRHWREQRDLEKSLIVESPHGGSGPQPLDLESGRIVLTPVDRRVRPAPRPDEPRRGAPDETDETGEEKP